MRLSKLALRLSVGVISPLFLIAAAAASGAGNDPCRVLTAETFSQIMGYKATLDKTDSNQTSCFYQGPADSGGQFTILTRLRQDRKRTSCSRVLGLRHPQAAA